MTDTHTNPPRWAEALLRMVLRPDDCESIPGDLLEEYREARRPSLGAFRANAWYLSSVLSFFVRVLWPCAIAIVALRIITFPLPRGWNPSLVPAPGTSALDAIIFLWAGYYGSQRTGRPATGALTAGVTSVIGFTIFFIYAALANPRLLLAPFEKPFIFVIIAALLAIALGFAVVAGAAGAAAGRRRGPPAPITAAP
jgi:hypothetical protein